LVRNKKILGKIYGVYVSGVGENRNICSGMLEENRYTGKKKVGITAHVIWYWLASKTKKTHRSAQSQEGKCIEINGTNCKGEPV
jgi:hypothetical protein